MGWALFPSGAQPAVHCVMTEEQKAVRVAAIREERAVYVKRGLADRVAACDAEIARLTGKPVAPAHQARAVRRPRVDPERETR